MLVTWMLGYLVLAVAILGLLGAVIGVTVDVLTYMELQRKLRRERAPEITP